MSTKEVADKLVAYCRTGAWEQAYAELYSPNCVSIEMPGQDFPERCEGMEAMKAKGERWNSMVEEFHGVEVSDPVVAGDFFSCNMTMDITMKGAPRMKNAELAVYKVEDGKVVSEQFFY